MSKETPIVMVIEDEELLLKAIEKKLSVRGIKCVTCTSGEQALDYLENFTEPPDGIWLDYRLKDMDGLEFLSNAQEAGKLGDVPVVVVSNTASAEKVSSMLALGAKKYLLKAKYRLEEIVNIMLDFINEKDN